MRWDMFKVIVERPRGGGGYPPKRGRMDQQARLDPEHAPLREPISRGRGSKHLNENLAPLRRYLLRQVGRPWDRVHAEISAHLRLTSAVQRHVLEHLADFVVTDVMLVDGRPVRARDRQPVLASRWRHICYVCPHSGLLRASPRRTWAPPPVHVDRVVLGDEAQLQRFAGVWYHLTMLPVPRTPEERRDLVDAVLGVRLDAPNSGALRTRLHQVYGRHGVYAARKLRLGERMLARFLPEGLR